MSIEQVKALFLESMRLEQTATTPEQYKQALAVARRALELTVPGSHPHANCLARVAALSADCGDYQAAIRMGVAAAHLIPCYQQAAPSMPYALFALGRAYSRLGDHRQAVTYLQQALDCATGELSERIRLTLARAYARAGRIADAWATLNGAACWTLAGKVHAARALILAKTGAWADCRREAQEALRLFKAGEARLFDAVEYAELLLCLKAAAVATGQNSEAAAWLVEVIRLCARWTAGLVSLLLSNQRQKGGGFFEAVSRCGAAGHSRCGLRGVCG